MTAIVAVNFDWSIESCDKAPRDLDYERNTEKYGRAMKLTINRCVEKNDSSNDLSRLGMSFYCEIFSGVVEIPVIIRLCLWSPRSCFFIVLNRDLFVYHVDSLTS